MVLGNHIPLRNRIQTLKKRISFNLTLYKILYVFNVQCLLFFDNILK